MKLYLIILSLFIVEIVYTQVLPQALLVNNNAYPTTISANASFDLLPVNKNIGTKGPFSNIVSDFTYSFNENTPYTIQFIVKGKSFGIVNFSIFFAFAPDANLKDDYSNTYINYFLSSNRIDRYNRPSFEENYIEIPYNLGDTVQITGTYDGANFSEYKNGVLVQTIARPAGSTWQTAPLHLILGNNKDFTTTQIDEVRFWNKALNATEISNNWNKTLTGNEPGLQLYFNFDDQGYPNDNNTAIQYIKDKTSNNYKGIISGSNKYGSSQNFVPEIISSKNINNNRPIISLDANNLDSYPGNEHGFNGNNNKSASLWHDPNSLTNIIFYKSENYNPLQLAGPILNADGGRSLLINNIYGKTNLNTGLDGDWPLTIEAWIKLNTLDNISVASIGENYDGNRFEMAILNNKLILNVGGNNQLSNTSTLITNKWYHMVCTYDNWQYNIFINGIKERTGWYVGPPPYSTFTENDVLVPLNIVNTPLYIGTSQRPFNGKIGILNMYNRALGTTEVLNKYNATKSRFGY